MISSWVVDELDACRAFVDAQGAVTTTHALAPALARAIEAGAATYPALRVDPVAFARFLGERIPPDVDAIEALASRKLADLYLVHACLAGEPAACAELETRFLAELRERLVRQRIAPDIAAETVQQLRVKLLVGARPLLLAYSGTGELRGWLRVTALRAAIRAQKKHAPPGDREADAAAALADAALDAGLLYQRRLYQEEFRAAFAEAVAALTVRERNLLKHSILYGATSDDLGALYKVHRATAARWLGDARARLAAETQRRMIERLQIKRDDYDSIMRLIQSQLDVSVERVLA